ncbi:uncharacterized protein LOC143143078 [Ptiloglossa arizonensis]|uniref:uncharacterized protein LOC143143078 n=1 Tax=Ptiloglossa arizonensis TaxID=3350558 RepID=UPI003F9F59EB
MHESPYNKHVLQQIRPIFEDLLFDNLLQRCLDINVLSMLTVHQESLEFDNVLCLVLRVTTLMYLKIGPYRFLVIHEMTERRKFNNKERNLDQQEFFEKGPKYS